MNINIQKFNEVAKAAKARTNDKRWTAAIDKAVAGVVSGWWVISELFDSVLVTTETGQTYHANGACQCRAYELGQPCKHRALARLITLYRESEAVQVAAPCAVLVTNSYAGRVETPVKVVCETPKKVRIRAVTETKIGGRNRWLAPGEVALVPKSAVKIERTIERNYNGAPFVVVRCDHMPI